ncbi:MAG: DUF6054 family protein [Acholeplasmataceae bacterium]|nr:DUF6054 family protein [Acholeplasmataceae bacterium]
MAIASFKGQGNISAIVNYLKNGIEEAGLTNALIHSIVRESSGGRTHLLVFEKWYYRNGSRASLTVMVTENDGIIMVDAIAAGGGQGLVFRFSWGAEENFVGIVRDLMVKKGFRE